MAEHSLNLGTEAFVATRDLVRAREFADPDGNEPSLTQMEVPL